MSARAIVTLARKMLTIIHHLLINGEEYVEEGFKKGHICRRLANFRDITMEGMAAVVSRSIVQGVEDFSWQIYSRFI